MTRLDMEQTRPEPEGCGPWYESYEDWMADGGEMRVYGGCSVPELTQRNILLERGREPGFRAMQAERARKKAAQVPRFVLSKAERTSMYRAVAKRWGSLARAHLSSPFCSSEALSAALHGKRRVTEEQAAWLRSL